MLCNLCKDYNETVYKKELITTIRYFFLNGLVSVGGGNHSFRSENPDQIWITPSGYPRSHIEEKDLVLIDLNGNIINGNLRPTIEIPFHTSIYKNRTDINSICHVHSPYTSGYFLSTNLKSTKMDGIFVMQEKPIIDSVLIQKINPLILDYKQLGSKALGNAVGLASTLNSVMPFGVIILLNHGIISMGRCIHEAKFLIEFFEEWAKCLSIKTKLRSK